MKWCSRLFEKGPGRKKDFIFISAVFFSWGVCIGTRFTTCCSTKKLDWWRKVVV